MRLLRRIGVAFTSQRQSKQVWGSAYVAVSHLFGVSPKRVLISVRQDAGLYTGAGALPKGRRQTKGSVQNHSRMAPCKHSL
jgi:hypothetical protein